MLTTKGRAIALRFLGHPGSEGDFPIQTGINLSFHSLKRKTGLMAFMNGFQETTRLVHVSDWYAEDAQFFQNGLERIVGARPHGGNNQACRDGDFLPVVDIPHFPGCDLRDPRPGDQAVA